MNYSNSKVIAASMLLVASISLSCSAFALSGKSDSNCKMSKLIFSAENLPSVPEKGSNYVWGGNATGGGHLLDPPYASDFLDKVSEAKSPDKGIGVFAYLEGPCGDTGGRDDGERARCLKLHNEFNSKYAPNTPDTDYDRWKPFTFAQLKASKKFKIDFCEIDNLNNNVNIDLIPLLKEIKDLYDTGAIRCRLVLKNLQDKELYEIKEQVARTFNDAEFIAPFHIFEASGLDQKPSLDTAMKALKGAGAVTIISTKTEDYGSAFTDDEFLSCID